MLAAACSGDGDSAAPPPEWVAPDQVGPYGIGVDTLEFVDARGKELVAEVWYPAAVEEGDEPDPYTEITITKDAYREAPPDLRGAPYPLLAFSHGYAGIRYQSVFLTERLASHGYVVVAVDHPHNTLLDIDEDATVQVLLERPDDVRASVDELLLQAASGHERLGGMVGTGLAGQAGAGGYGIIGHSFGAFTAMVLGGGILDYQGVLDHCASSSAFVCGYLEKDFDPAVAEQHGAADERVLATVPMSPGVWYAFGGQAEGLQSVRQPMVLGGDKDNVLDYATEIRPCFEGMGLPKAMGTLADAGHYAFSDVCDIAAFMFDDCDEEEGGWISMERAHEITNTLVTAFVDLHVAGEERAAEWLDASYLDGIPELSWEVEE